MKLKELEQAFDPLTEVYDSITDFQRKWELTKNYKELKEKIDWLNSEKMKIFRKYAGQDNKVDARHRPKFEAEIDDLLETQIEIKPLFTIKEIENSKIKGSHLVMILDFVKDNKEE